MRVESGPEGVTKRPLETYTGVCCAQLQHCAGVWTGSRILAANSTTSLSAPLEYHLHSCIANHRQPLASALHCLKPLTHRALHAQLVTCDTCPTWKHARVHDLHQSHTTPHHATTCHPYLSILQVAEFACQPAPSNGGACPTLVHRCACAR